MAILGIGVDLLFVPRLRALITRRGAERLAKRILSPAERAEWDVRHQERAPWCSDRELSYLGVRWAAKEAVYKAMFPGRRLSWQEVTVAKSANGLKPELQVDAIAAAASPSPPSHSLVCHLSISHDGDYIVAQPRREDIDVQNLYGPSSNAHLSNPHNARESEAGSYGTAGGSAGTYGGDVGVGELVEVADKSCSQCRIRKVKCDRALSKCTRCRKRGEPCDYGEGVASVMRRVLPKPSSASTAPAAPYTPPVANRFAGNNDSRPSYSTGNNFPPPAQQSRPPSFLLPPARFTEFSLAPSPSNSSASSSTSTLSPAQIDRVPNDIATSWDQFLRTSDIGPRSLDWKLAQPAMASSLTISLIEASLHSCCFHLPAFHVFEGRIAHYKSNLNNLDIASQVVVAILTSLGARASPHSALLGIEGPKVDHGAKPSHELLLTAGRRRENAWRAITDRAVDLCSRLEILNSATQENIETLLAVTNMLLFSEVVPVRARFFLRQALGLFKDVHAMGIPESELRALKKAIGPALYESDARTAAYANMPFLIRESDLRDFFEGTGVQVPNLDQQDLGTDLDNILSPRWGPITRAKLDEALSITGYYVSAVQRLYASIVTDQRSPRILMELPDLWSKIDRVHGAVQKLHRSLSTLTYTPSGCEDDHQLDYDLLIGVRMDARMVDLVNLAHMRLLTARERFRWTPHEPLLEELISLSDKRVRKCLKLLAFYSKVFAESLDKHVVYHLTIQMEVIPWVPIAISRVGEPGGPTSTEYEVSETELGWFTDAYSLACFYTPLAATRLAELQQGLDARRFTPASQSQPSQFSPLSSGLSPVGSSSGSTSSSQQSAGALSPVFFPAIPPSPSGSAGYNFSTGPFSPGITAPYSPGIGHLALSGVDFSQIDFSNMLAPGADSPQGQQPQVRQGGGDLPVFDEDAWQKELGRW